jgi:hypothetical protein
MRAITIREIYGGASTILRYKWSGNLLMIKLDREVAIQQLYGNSDVAEARGARSDVEAYLFKWLAETETSQG